MELLQHNHLAVLPVILVVNQVHNQRVDQHPFLVVFLPFSLLLFPHRSQVVNQLANPLRCPQQSLPSSLHPFLLSVLHLNPQFIQLVCQAVFLLPCPPRPLHCRLAKSIQDDQRHIQQISQLPSPVLYQRVCQLVQLRTFGKNFTMTLWHHCPL